MVVSLMHELRLGNNVKIKFWLEVLQCEK